MRILLLPQSYPPRLGGLEIVAETLATQLSRRGHAIRVVTNRYPRDLPAREVLEGIEVERMLFLPPRAKLLRRRRLDLWLASLIHGPATRWRLDRIVWQFRPHVVNVHFPDVMMVDVLRLRRRHSFRLVVSLHGNDVERFSRDGVGSAELCALLREADAVTACSRRLLELAYRLEPCIAGKGTPIYNGIHPQRFLGATAYRHERPYILAVGRLTYTKGIDLLIEAFARIAPSETADDLLIAGEGEAREEVMGLARRLGVDERVRFLGGVTPEAAVQLLKGCRFAVVPSRSEGFGLVALECLAAGKPLLATRVGGMAEFLEHLRSSAAASGSDKDAMPLTLVDPTTAALTDGLRACLQAEWSVECQEALTATALREFSWDRVGERYEAVLTGQTTRQSPLGE